MKLKIINKKSSGRNSSGRITVRHRGGGSKRYYRLIDFKRDKKDIWGVVEAIEYDPNRNVDIALVLYKDGERRYVLASDEMKVGSRIISGIEAEAKNGHCLPLKNIPIGTILHNLEITPGKGGQLVRGAGGGAVLLSKDTDYAQIKLPSGEVRLFLLDCWATIGQLGRTEHKLEKKHKAGDTRHAGIRPTVRGVAQNPNSHPHGGGEGRSGIGMPGPKTPWGKPALGKRTRNKYKYSKKLIIKRRK